MELFERDRPPAPLLTRLILWGVIFALYVPLIVMVIGAWIRRDADGISFTTQWYRDVFADPSLGEAMARSFFVALVSSVIATAIGTLTAVALEKTEFRGKGLVRALSMASLVMPELVFALSLLSWFVLLQFELGLTTVIFAHVTFSLAYVMLTISARLHALDPSLADAGRDLGASERQILMRVVLPLLKPAMLAAFLLCFLLSFDDFLITFYTTGAGSDTLPIKLYTAMRMGLTPKLNALASLMLLASLILIFLFMRLGGLRSLLSSHEAD